MDQRTLRELYTLPFEIAIKQGNPGGIMCAFNEVNNVPSCGNPTILNTILRDEIGFEGWVVTDFGCPALADRGDPVAWRRVWTRS